MGRIPRAAAFFLFVPPAFAQTTVRVNVDSSGNQTSGFSEVAAISADDRYVAFHSYGINLVPGDTNAIADVFVRDRMTGTTERVSVSSGGAQADVFGSFGPAISSDGRFVAFSSYATNLVAGDTNGLQDVFVRDRMLGTTERVSVDSAGVQGNDESSSCAISEDGRFVAFASVATNLVAGDTNNKQDIFVRDRMTGTTTRASVGAGGAQANDTSHFGPSISADGRCVVFGSSATNLVAGDTNAVNDVFLRDRMTATTERVSVSSGGVQGNAACSPWTAVSDDGQYVAFASTATNLVAGDTNASDDLFVRDRMAGTTERASVATGGAQGNGGCNYPAISSDGRYVAFQSFSSNLVAGDTNAFEDVFLRDRMAATTERVSVDSFGAQGNGPSSFTSLSVDGSYVAFVSAASNLVVGDTNFLPDIFVRNRNGGPNLVSVCHPGISGVIACPCGNPPSGAGRGCDNSSSTGGATLAAAGATVLSSDSLVFTTSGEKPTATSVLLQGTSSPAAGVVYGQGVRCVGGTLKRLFTKTAVGGSITAPNFGAGDPTVSARSAAKGNPIAAGQSRWYLVFYRDPTVLGGCPATSTFNATQTGRIEWSP
jgi:Tol biopolymer transport system component